MFPLPGCGAKAQPPKGGAQLGNEVLRLTRPELRGSQRSMTDSPQQSRDPLHGVTLERMLERLVEQFGWPAMGKRIPIRCFLSDPSISSSLKFLRKTPWARAKVEALYLEMVQRQAP